MSRRLRRSITAAVSVPAALLVSWAPTAPAATVLAVEGTGQRIGATQTAFSGAFCHRNACRSIDNDRGPFDVVTGSEQIQAAVDSTEGDIIVLAYSLGAASTYNRLRAWEADFAQAPDVGRVKLIVTLGNPENRFGGADRKNAYAGLPTVQPYEHLDVAMQYDSVADRPTRKSFLSRFNASIAQHMGYFKGVDVNDPDNLVYRDADGTTYMLIRADVLPMLRWVDWLISDETIAKLDAQLRPLIERDYDRPAYIPQGEGADWGNGIAPPTVQNFDDAADTLQPPVAEASRRHKPDAGDARHVEDEVRELSDDEESVGADADADTDAELDPETADRQPSGESESESESRNDTTPQTPSSDTDSDTNDTDDTDDGGEPQDPA